LAGTSRAEIKTMKRLLAVTGIFVALVLAAPSASAQTQTWSYHCWFRVDAQNGPPWGTMYSSEVFGTTLAASVIVQDWYTYIAATHPYGAARASGTCEVFSSSPDSQKYSLSLEEKSWTANDLTIVNVNYTPGDGAKAPPPKPAAPPAAPAQVTGPAMHYYCLSKPGQVITYFSAAFDTPESDARILASAYDMFLQEKYHRKSDGLWSCPVFPTLADAQADEQKQVNQLHSTNQQVVETGWTYATP